MVNICAKVPSSIVRYVRSCGDLALGIDTDEGEMFLRKPPPGQFKNTGNFSHSRTEHLWRTKMWPRVRHQVTNSEPTFGAPHMLGT